MSSLESLSDADLEELNMLHNNHNEYNKNNRDLINISSAITPEIQPTISTLPTSPLSLQNNNNNPLSTAPPTIISSSSTVPTKKRLSANNTLYEYDNNNNYNNKRVKSPSILDQVVNDIANNKSSTVPIIYTNTTNSNLTKFTTEISINTSSTVDIFSHTATLLFPYLSNEILNIPNKTIHTDNDKPNINNIISSSGLSSKNSLHSSIEGVPPQQKPNDYTNNTNNSNIIKLHQILKIFLILMYLLVHHRSKIILWLYHYQPLLIHQ